MGSYWTAATDTYDNDAVWNHCKHVVSRSRDTCKTGSWVFANFQVMCISISFMHRRRLILKIHGAQTSVVAGRIVKILNPQNVDPASKPSQALVLLELFTVASVKHPRFDMPILTRSQSSENSAIVASTVCNIYHYHHIYVNVDSRLQSRISCSFSMRSTIASIANAHPLQISSLFVKAVTSHSVATVLSSI